MARRLSTLIFCQASEKLLIDPKWLKACTMAVRYRLVSKRTPASGFHTYLSFKETTPECGRVETLRKWRVDHAFEIPV